MLFDATDGQHRLSGVLVANNSRGGNEADLWLLEDQAGSWASNRFGQAGFHCELGADERFKPFIILHEFSHYAYHVHDEYAGVGGVPAECVGGSTANACIMESRWRNGDRFGNNADGGPLVRGRLREYCHAGNHDPDGDTRQHANHGQSCWETMVDRYDDLVRVLAAVMQAVAEQHRDLGGGPRAGAENLVERVAESAADGRVAGCTPGVDW